MSSKAIAVESLSKRFGSLEALTDVDLVVESNELCAVIGPSGCGKSTLLRCIAGMEDFENGTVRLRGESAENYRVEDRDLGYVFQEFEEALFPHKTVAENIEFGLEQDSTTYTESEKDELIDDMVELLSISSTKYNLPGELSGGQQQRVELARHLVRENDIVLLDDPLADLDYKLQKRMELELRRLHSRLDSAFVYVTHNQDQALKLADKIVVMNEGRIEQVGTANEVYEDPKTAFVGRFLGDSNAFSASLVKEHANSLTIDTDIGELAATSANGETPPSDSIVLVRPEAIRIGPSAADCDNEFVGTVEGQTYTGETTEISVSIDGREDPIHIVESDRQSIGAVGESVAIGWDRTDTTYFETLSVTTGINAEDLEEI